MPERVTIPFDSYGRSVSLALDLLDAGPVLAGQQAILIKPNLVNASPHPVTTSVGFCEAVILALRRHTTAGIVVAEGTGDAVLETSEVFDRLGYTGMARRTGVELIDLNHAPLKTLSDPVCDVFPEIHLPEIAFSHFIISLPVLKAHSLAGITGTRKNMIGFAPPAYYGGAGGWKKSTFHARMHEAINDLNRYRTPDLTLMDASVGLADNHLGGPVCDPPVDMLIAGFDGLDVDRTAAGLLGIDPDTIPHLVDAAGGRWVSFWKAKPSG